MTKVPTTHAAAPHPRDGHTFAGPTLHCGLLPAFDQNDWASVDTAFAAVTPLAMQQAWLDKPQPQLRPSAVRAGWRDATLWVLADLTDEDIFNRATTLNEHMWTLGDVFEIFLRSQRQEAYFELHVTPENNRLQIRLEHPPLGKRDRDLINRREVPPPFHYLEGEAFWSRTLVLPEENRWRVLAGVPTALIAEDRPTAEGDEWIFSFSRYDYTHNHVRPVLSSTSPHHKVNFHRQFDWGRLIFVG